MSQRPSVGGLRAVVVLALASLVTALSGCTPTAEPEPSTSPTVQTGQGTSLLPPAEGKTQYPLTLVTEFGETVLPERPERIAAVVPNAIDTELLLSLGVMPILTSSMVSEAAAWLNPKGAADIDTYPFIMGEGLNVEAIAASDPDLIVVTGWGAGIGGVSAGDYYDQLAAIAPVVGNSPGSEGQFLIPWQDSLRVLGETLDLADAAEQVISDLDADFATIRADHPEFGGLRATWTIWYGTNGLQYLSQPGSAPEELLLSMGFAANPGAEKFADDRAVSEELLNLIDADVLIIGRSAAGEESEFNRLIEGTLFQNLGAVRSGQWLSLPPKTDDGGDLLWAITSGGPIGHLWAAEHLVPGLAELL